MHRLPIALLLAAGTTIGAYAQDAPLPSVYGHTPCANGEAADFACHAVDLLAFVSLPDLVPPNRDNTYATLNDHWGWTDRASGREFVLAGHNSTPVFVEITDPERPAVLGHLAGGHAFDVKVYGHHALFNGGSPPGLRVFDLHRLLDVAGAPVTFTADTLFQGFGSAHNLAVNEAAGFAYAVGGYRGDFTCASGLYMIDVRDPERPQTAGCYGDIGYIHDVQCVIYHGPDDQHRGREVCFASTPGIGLAVIDVTDKAGPTLLATRAYPNMRYAHQGWLTEDHRHFLFGDEEDENGRNNTRTLVWDVQDLDDPILVAQYEGRTPAVDHNQYVDGRYTFQANYDAGLSILDLQALPDLQEVAYFDTVPDGYSGFRGAWTSYPFFPSGVVTVTSINEGLFVLRPTDLAGRASTAADAPCAGGCTRPATASLTAHPNPATSAAEVVLRVDAPQAVRVDVFDALGRRVRRLYAGETVPGAPLRLRFDASTLPPGLYHVRAVGAAFRAHTQLVVVR